MTTDIPVSITAPDKAKTSIGTFNFFDGVPDEVTVDKVYDYLDRSRAVEAFLNCIPAMSMYSIREGQRNFGVDASNKVIIPCIFEVYIQILKKSRGKNIHLLSCFNKFFCRPRPLSFSIIPTRHPDRLTRLWQAVETKSY